MSSPYRTPGTAEEPETSISDEFFKMILTALFVFGVVFIGGGYLALGLLGAMHDVLRPGLSVIDGSNGRSASRTKRPAITPPWRDRTEPAEVPKAAPEDEEHPRWRPTYDGTPKE